MKKSHTKFNFIKYSLLATLIISLSILNLASAIPGDIDSDGDGLIDISSIEQLNNIRYNLLGTSYKTSTTSTEITTGCPTIAITRIGGTLGTGCYGYELTKSLDFNLSSSYSSGSINTAYTSGNGWSPIGDNFNSVFNGNGYSISNLYINKTENISADYGLFSNTLDNTIIQNLSIINPYISITSTPSISNVGGLVGNGSGIFRNIAVIGGYLSNDSNIGANTAGLIGNVSSPSSNISNVAVINTKLSSTNGYMGGIVGFSFSTTINHTYSLPKEFRYNLSVSTGQIVGRILNFNGSNAVPNFNNNFYTNDYANLYTPATSTTPMPGSSNTPLGTNDLTFSPLATSATLNDFTGNGSNNLSASNTGSGFTYIRNIVPKVNLYDTNTPLEVFNRFVSAPGYIDGDGDGLIDISSIEQLNNIRYNLLGTSYKTSSVDIGASTGCHEGCYGYELTKSLDFDSASSYSSGSINTAYTSGNGWSPIGSHNTSPFAAVFSGNGYTISNLFIYSTANITTGIGLFAHTSSLSTIQDLSLFNPSISTVASSQVGGLIGRGGGTIRNIAIVGGSISAASQVGALIGRLDLGGSIPNPVSNIAVIGSRITATNGDLGGIAGYSNQIINNSYSLPKELRATTLSTAGEIIGRSSIPNPTSNSFYINNFQNIYNPTTATTSLPFSNNVSIGSTTSITGGVTLNDMIGTGSNNLSSSNLGSGFSYSQNNLPKVNLYNTSTPLNIFNTNYISDFVTKVSTNNFGAIVTPTFNNNIVTFSPSNYTYYTDNTLLNLDNTVINNQYTFNSSTKIKTFYFRDTFNNSGQYTLIYNPNTNFISNLNIDSKITDNGSLTADELASGFTISGNKDIYNPLRISIRQDGVVKGYKDINFVNSGYVKVVNKYNNPILNSSITNYLLNYVYFNPDNTAVKKCVFMEVVNTNNTLKSYSFKSLTSEGDQIEECPSNWTTSSGGFNVGEVNNPATFPLNIAFAFANKEGFGTNPETFSTSFNSLDLSSLNQGSFNIHIDIPSDNTTMYVYASGTTYTSPNYNYTGRSVMPIIISQPASTTILTKGENTTLSVIATSTVGMLSYQWQIGINGTTFTNIDGATSSNYTTLNNLPMGTYYLRVSITNTEDNKSVATTSSDVVTLSINPVRVSGITVSTSSITLTIGATYTIGYTIIPPNASTNTVTWHSSDTSVATVGTTTGLVTGVGAGSTTITVTTDDGEKTATTSVTVTAPVINYTHITSISQLQAINNNLTGNYILDNDLDLSSIPNFTPIGSSASPFYGTFNGNGHTISNLKISAGENTGLFGYTASSSRIENFTISNPNIIGGNNTASAIGYNQGIVNNIGIINGNISSDGTYTGGVIGHSKGTTTNVYYIGNITGKGVGGVIGLLESTTLSNSFSRGNIITSVGYASNNTPSGGIVASLSSATINNSYSLSSLYGNRSFLAGMAGFVWDGNINNSYSDSYMTGGFYYYGSYSTGGITSRIGNNEGGRNVSVSNVYYNNANKGYEQANGLGQFISINPPNSAVPQSVLYSSTTLSLGNQFQLSGNNNYPAVLNSITGEILGGTNQLVSVSAPIITVQSPAYNYTINATATIFNVSVSALPIITNYNWEVATTSSSGPFTTLFWDRYDYKPDTSATGTKYYRLITTNALGVSTSSVITVIVTEPVSASPVITTHPSNQSINTGGTATFSVSASSATGTLSYQWQSSSDNLTFTNIAGETSSSYTTPTQSATGTSYYRVVISNVEIGKAVSTVNSNSATLSITTSVNIPVTGVSVTPTTTSLLTGATTSISATVSPNNASNQNVNWSSSDNSVATVGVTTGLVTAISAGTATITATTIDGSFTATSIVTVSNSVPTNPSTSTISGSIYHHSSTSKSIPGAIISLTNTNTNTLVSTTTTNNIGEYVFNNVTTGANYSISVSYTSSSSTTGININDNVRNAQIIVGTYTPTDDAKISADTNQDGIININDNVRNAQIIVGTYILPIPFIFIPTDKTDHHATSTENSITKKNYLWSSYQSKTITNLNSDTTINFKGYKVGDSNGDWR